MSAKKEILEKLGAVIDPELGISVVDLGLIYRIDVVRARKGEKRKARIAMTFTTPACPMMGSMLSEMKQKLEEIPDMDIDIEVVFQPLWTPDRMSRNAKIKLGMV